MKKILVATSLFAIALIATLAFFSNQAKLNNKIALFSEYL